MTIKMTRILSAALLVFFSYSGRIIKVVDEGLYLSVWLTDENLTKEEDRLFK